MSRSLKTVAFAATLALVAQAPATAQSVEEVLDRYYEAIGGLDAWKNLQTMKASGTLDVMGGMAQGPFSIVQKRPSKFVMEIDIQGLRIVQAFDGETAWQINPMLGSAEPQEADESTEQVLKEQSDLDGPLIGWREDGNQIAVVGHENVDGTDAIKLEVTLKNGETSYYYLDGERYVPIRIVSVREIQGAPTESSTILGDYREVGGLLFPFSIEVDTPVGRQALTFDTIEVNVEVDDGAFSMSSGG